MKKDTSKKYVSPRGSLIILSASQPMLNVSGKDIPWVTSTEDSSEESSDN